MRIDLCKENFQLYTSGVSSYRIPSPDVLSINRTECPHVLEISEVLKMSYIFSLLWNISCTLDLCGFCPEISLKFCIDILFLSKLVSLGSYSLASYIFKQKFSYMLRKNEPNIAS